MAHLASTLPPRVEQGAVRHLDYETDVVTTDGGFEVRNARWDTPLRRFDVSFPTSPRGAEDYVAVLALYKLALGRLHSFDFKDWTTGETVKVRFDSTLSITGVDRVLDHIETVALVEVRE